MAFKDGGVIDAINTFILGEAAMTHELPTRKPAAYIITSNRGRRYLAFASSVEHQNAAMFGYEMKPLYEDLK